MISVVALDMAQIVVNAMLGVWLANLSLTNPVVRFARRRQWIAPLAIVKVAAITLVGTIAFHSAVIVGCWVSAGRAGAVLASSGILLHWAMLSYFSLQKYGSDELFDRPILLMKHPLYLPICLAVAELSAIAAILQHLRWFWALVLIPVWCFYGIVALEWKLAAIKRKHGVSRRDAIRRINVRDGLSMGTFMRMDKYPFP